MKKGQWSEKKDVRLGNICLAFDGKMPMTRLLTPADYSGYSIGCLSKAKPKAIFCQDLFFVLGTFSFFKLVKPGSLLFMQQILPLAIYDTP